MKRRQPDRPMKRIPIRAAQQIAQEFGYDQVIILARRCGKGSEPHGEHVTTYGTNKQHCKVAADCGNYLKYRVMGWPDTKGVTFWADLTKEKST